MGCCFSSNKKKKPRFEITDNTPKVQEYDYLRPESKIIYNTDTTYNVPKIDIAFDDRYVNEQCSPLA